MPSPKPTVYVGTRTDFMVLPLNEMLKSAVTTREVRGYVCKIGHSNQGVTRSILGQSTVFGQGELDERTKG